MPKIATHIFSSKGTSNNSQTTNMREPVSITTYTRPTIFRQPDITHFEEKNSRPDF